MPLTSVVTSCPSTLNTDRRTCVVIGISEANIRGRVERIRIVLRQREGRGQVAVVISTAVTVPVARICRVFDGVLLDVLVMSIVPL